MENNKMENAFNMLVDVVVEEYRAVKSDLKYQMARNEHLMNQNEALRITEQKNAEAFARLKKLLAPSISWFSGKPLCILGVTAEALNEVCDILKIEEQDKTDKRGKEKYSDSDW